jgi:hypothetical protein
MGVMKLEAFQWCFVTKLNTPQAVTFFVANLKKLVVSHFFEKFIKIW